MQRQIYSSNLGLLTGVSLSILVAKIYQDNPTNHIVELVYKFFETYSQHDWKIAIGLDVGMKYGMKPYWK